MAAKSVTRLVDNRELSALAAQPTEIPQNQSRIMVIVETASRETPDFSGFLEVCS